MDINIAKNQSQDNTEEDNLEVVHLGQHHLTPNSNEVSVALTTISQIKIIDWLKSNGLNEDTAVLTEGLSETLGPKEREENPLAMVARGMIFPEGMPEDLNSLNELQKEFITEIGAAKTLYFLGDIDTLYPTTSKEQSNSAELYVNSIIDKYGEKTLGCLVQFDSETNNIIMDQRENHVVELVKNLQSKYKKAVIVYGAAHNFSDNFAKEDMHHKYVNLASPMAAVQRDLELEFLDRKSALQKCVMPKISAFSNLSELEHPDLFAPLKPLSEFGDKINNALSYYGNRRDQGNENILLAQKEILDKITNGEIKTSLKAWGWQHFPEGMQKEALEYVDPNSINEYFTPRAMLENANNDKELYNQISNWLNKHNLN